MCWLLYTFNYKFGGLKQHIILHFQKLEVQHGSYQVKIKV